MKTLKILSRHTSVAAAVEAAKIDLSFNEELAKRDLKDFERGNREVAPVREAYVVELEGVPQSYDTINPETGKAVEVWYRYEADIRLLNKYSAFHHMMHDGHFYPVTVKETEITINDQCPMRRNARKEIGKLGVTVTTL